jgi:hypothetical protein
MLVWKTYFIFQETPFAGGHPCTTNNGETACSLSKVAQLLAVMALRKTIMSFIGLYPDCDVAKAWQYENFL